MLPKLHVLPSFNPLTSVVILHTTLGLPIVLLVPSSFSFPAHLHLNFLLISTTVSPRPVLLQKSWLQIASVQFSIHARCSLLMFLFVMKNSTSPSCLQWRKKRHYLCHQNSSLSLLWRAGCSFRWVLTEERFHLPPLFNVLYLQNLTRLLHPLSRCVNASVFWISLSFLNITSSVSHLCRFILINDHWWQLGVFWLYDFLWTWAKLCDSRRNI